MDASGREPVECSCSTCQNMCKRAPCIGTPSDILVLIQNGYIDQLEMSIWSAGIPIGIPEIEMVQLDYNDGKGCKLQVNGLCSIHHIKPTDGRLATCKPEAFVSKTPAVGFVALTWMLPENQHLISFIEYCVLLFKSVGNKNHIINIANTFNK